MKRTIQTGTVPSGLLGLLGLTGLFLVLGPVDARAQDGVTLLDEAGGNGYYEDTAGQATGSDSLALAGPDATRLPATAEAAFEGTESGRLRYRHTDGAWTLEIRTAGDPLDFAGIDSLVLYLNAPLGIPGVELPVLDLVDASGVATAALPLPAGDRIGYAAGRSGFTAESATDAALAVSYSASLPVDLVRPGYPEDLRLVFAGAVVDTSRAAVGVPAVPARFTVETATGRRLAFRFRDTDADGTLGASGEYVEILTPESGADGATLRPTWRVDVDAAPQVLPTAGDVFVLAVDNAGVDGDPATWQRVAVALDDFGPLGAFDRTAVRAARLANGPTPTEGRILWLDAVTAVDADPAGDPPPAPTGLDATAGDASVVVAWEAVPDADGYIVYRRSGADGPFERLTGPPVTQTYFADVDAVNEVAARYIVRTLGEGGRLSADSEPVDALPDAGLPDAYLDLTARLAFDYFWNEANPSNGLIRDRSTNPDLCSIAAVGFGLSAYTVGVDRGWITREDAVARTLNTLDFFWNAPQGTGTNVTGYRGFFYHFLNMDTGYRVGTNELSTIDTALLLGGILHAATYYDADTPDEASIRALADSIYQRVDWAWAAPRPPRVALGWKPETGFLPFDWSGYNEAMLIYLLGLGSPTHPLDDGAWDAWTDTYDWATHYGFSFVEFPPLFGHQYTHVWVDFRGIQDAYMRGRGIDYFENSRRATLANRAYAVANPRGYPNYGPDEWGLTASDDPLVGYQAHGAPPAQNDNGTITPTAAGGSFPFTPEASSAALRQFYRVHRDRLWGPYGLRDAYNVEEDWYAAAYLGIDQGPILLMIENHRTGAIWERFMQVEAVQVGLERAGFEPTPTAAEDRPETPIRAAIDAVYPHPVGPHATRSTVRIAVPNGRPATLAAYDVLGRQVAVLAAGLAPGVHDVALDAAGWASGVYLLRLDADGQVATRTVVRVR